MGPYRRITIVDIEDGSYGQAVDAHRRMRELWNDDMGISEDDCPRGLGALEREDDLADWRLRVQHD